MYYHYPWPEFCPHCGEEFQPVAIDENRAECLECGREVNKIEREIKL